MDCGMKDEGQLAVNPRKQMVGAIGFETACKRKHNNLERSRRHDFALFSTSAVRTACETAWAQERDHHGAALRKVGEGPQARRAGKCHVDEIAWKESYKKGCQEEYFLPPLARVRNLADCIQPRLFPRRVSGLTALNTPRSGESPS